MNILLWILQVLPALLYGASGVTKMFLFDEISEGVRSLGALPRNAGTAPGILELVCTAGLIVPAALHRQPTLTVVAAGSGDREPSVCQRRAGNYRGAVSAAGEQFN